MDSTLITILNQHCNIGHANCHSNESCPNEILSKEKLKKIIDLIFTNLYYNEKRFSFDLCDELKITWELIEWAVEYINSIKKEMQLIRISIKNQGTLLLNEKIDFLKKNNIHIGIFFCILPSIQYNNKKYLNQAITSLNISYDTIELLKKNNISFVVRSNIDKYNVNLMADIVLFISENYKNINQLRFDHIINENDARYFDDFIDNFLIAKTIGKEKGIYVHNYLSKSIGSRKIRFNKGSFCFKENGDIVICNNDKMNNKTIKNIKLNTPQYKKEECESCFVKWNCSEQISMQRLVISNEKQVMICNFIKRLFLKLLMEYLED